MKTTLFVICLVVIILYLNNRRKTKENNIPFKTRPADYDLRDKLNPLLQEYLVLTDNLKKTISSSNEVLNLNNFSLDKNLLKEQIGIAHQNGKFESVIDDYIHRNFDSIDYIANNLLEIAKKNSQLNDFQLNNIDAKMDLLLSDLQLDITNKLEKIPLFGVTDVDDIKSFLIDLILKSKNQIVKFHLDEK